MQTRKRLWANLALVGIIALSPALPAAAQVIPSRIICADGRHATDPAQCSPDVTAGGGASGSSMRMLSGGGGDESATIAEMYATRLKASQEITAGGDAPFGETISLYTGELNLRQTDIRVSGTGPDIVLTRFNSYLGAWLGMLPLPFGSWNASIPRIELLVSTPTVNNMGTVGGNWTAYGTGQRCSQFVQTDAMWQSWWGGIQFIDEQGTAHEMLGRASGNTAQPTISVGGSTLAFPIVTQDNWQVGCLPATANGEAGEAFLAVSPDGTKYWFDYAVGDPGEPYLEPDPIDPAKPLRFGRMLARMYVTRIEDRFGNSLIYTYSGDKLSAINASDGRQVTFAWRSDSRRIDTISVVGATTRTWSYSYDTNGILTGVTLPDSSTWVLSNVGIQGGPSAYGESTAGWPWTMCDVNGPMKTYPGVSTATIKNPAGLTGTFSTQLIFRGRSYVPSVCLQFGADPAYEGIPTTFGSGSLVSRTISGPGVPSATWTYAYTTGWGSHTRDPCASAGTCPDKATTTITSPDGNRTVLTYSTRWGTMDGKLLKEEAYQGTSTLLRTTEYTYAEATHGPYPARVGIAMINGTSTANVDAQETWTPTIKRKIDQQGVTFSHTVAATGLDTFAREIDATDAGTSTRQVVTTYHDNTAPWILGQVATRNVAGVQAERTDYDSADRPWKVYGFGKLRQTLTYNADGTLATATDGNNNITTFTSWKRGIPQSIQFPATPEAPAGATRTALVDNNGWITAVTDENGYATGYGYDTMGRLASIAYPTGDSTAWNGTTIAFVPVASAEYGIDAGHWRQTVSTGNARKVTYYNAQWRPVLVREYDTGNVAGTDRYTASAYDKLGRVWRSAYPVAAAPTMSAAADWSLSGTRTTYDALGRPTSVVQDAEAPYGTLTTSTSYGTGFETTVTNARSKVTTSTFQAWDQPVTDFPLTITHPEGAYTHITRDAFGKPTRIRRSDNSDPTLGAAMDRNYTYNANQELCRVVEPEVAPAAASSGATLMGYDGAGNLSWSASGLDKDSACSSTGNTTAINARKAARTYDARNRVSTLAFPDANGNQSWSYTPDGLPASVTTYNDGGASSVVNTYTYNKRRLPVAESLQQTGSPDTWAMGYGYDGNAGPASLVYPTGLTLTNTANALGQPTQVASAAQTYASAISYFPNGALKQFTYGNGIVHTLTQNARGLPAISQDASGATAIHQDEYDYDQVGNVLAITDGATGQALRGNRDMAYDGLDRLTSTTSPMFGTASYTYDVLDNLRHVQVTGGTQPRNQDYVYDTANRLTNITVGGATVTGLGYDAQGNLANKNGQLYAFDYGNRLRSATGLESYRYDANGRRVSATSSAGTIYSFYGQDGALRYQRDERQAKAFDYISLAGSLLARRSTPITISSVPPVPTLTVPGTSTTGNYTVSWSTSVGATHYELSEQVGGGSWTVVQDTGALSKAISGKANGSYGYRVRACNGAGTGYCSAYTATKTITVTLPAIPPVPTLNVPGTSTTGSYTVSWNATTGATHYELSEPVGGGSWTVIQDTSALSKAISGKASGSYGYRVRACNGAGTAYCSAYTATGTITVTLPAVPPVPTVTVPATSNTGSYTVSWTTSAGATHYELSEQVGGGSWTVIQDTSALSKAVSGKADGVYGYRVRACNGSGTGTCSAYSSTGTVTVALPPAPVIPSVPSTNNTGAYTVSWGASSGATHYELSEQIGGGSWAVVQDSAATSWNASGKANGSYGYRARACKGAGTGNCSAYSSTATVTVTLPPPPPTLSVPASSSTGSYTVTWTTSSGATHYELSEQVGGGGWTPVQDTSAVSKAVTGKTDGTYGYRVRACIGAGTGNCSANSNVGTITVILPPPIPATPTLSGYKTIDNSTRPPLIEYFISWTASTGATYYDLQQLRGSNTSIVYSGAGLSFNDVGGTSRSFWVRACNATGCSAWSPELAL